MKNKEFREAFEKEGVCLQNKIFTPTAAEKKSLKIARENFARKKFINLKVLNKISNINI